MLVKSKDLRDGVEQIRVHVLLDRVEAVKH